MTLRQTVFRLLPLCTQIVSGTPWTATQADEAERLVREIAALSIVERNGGPGVETQQACGIERVDGANDAVPDPDPLDTPLPCPFCVEPVMGPKYREWRGDSWVDHNVVCEDCIAVGPDGTSEADAIRRWNQRAPAKVSDDDARRALR